MSVSYTYYITLIFSNLGADTKLTLPKSPALVTQTDNYDMISVRSYNSRLSRMSKSKKVDIKATGRPQKSSLKPPSIDQKVGPQSFSVIKLLGTGSFGEVFLVSHIEIKFDYKL